MASRARMNFWLDVVIGFAFGVTVITGLVLWLVLPGGYGRGSLTLLALSRHAWKDLHVWAGVIMLGGVLLHLALHWRWIICVAGRLFHTSRSARLNFVVDAFLLAAFIATSFSGLVAWVLPSGGWRGGSNPFYGASWWGLTRHGWGEVHLWASLVMLGVILLHLVLHWKWIMHMLHLHTLPANHNLFADECAIA